MGIIAVAWAVISVMTLVVLLWHDGRQMIDGRYRFGDWGWFFGGVIFAPLMWAFFAGAWCVQELVYWIKNRNMKRRFGNGLN